MEQVFLRRCVELALKGDSRTFPNPKVGALLVYKNTIIGEGYHAFSGGPHAEVNAVASVRDKSLISGSTLYVSLEPCNHHGKTPPCTELIIKENIRNVVVGCTDPNPLVAGKGVAMLREHGVSVVYAQDSAPFERINASFFINQHEKRPLITLKWAESADGFIAPFPPAPYPITGQESLVFSHALRQQHHAIMIGKNTALIDNPRLTNRYFPGNSPIRIVWDRKLSLPSTLHLFDDISPTIVLNDSFSGEKGSVRFLKIPEEASNDLSLTGQILYGECGICSILVEGGTHLLNQFIQQEYFDEMWRFVGIPHLFKGIPAPKLKDITYTVSERVKGFDRIYHYQK